MTYAIRSSAAISLALALALLSNAQAASWPQHPLRLVVPFPAGGPVDITTRTISPRLSQALGQSVVIDNRGGASSIIGSDLVAKSNPDGYTLLVCSTTNTINASVMPKLPFDIQKDFIPINMIALITSILVVHPSVQAHNVRELISLAQSKPGQFTYGSAGNASPSHLAGELFKVLSGINIIHIPYKGGAPADIDQLSGKIQLSFLSAPATVPHIKTGALRALGVTNARRSILLPEIPTIAESGLPGYESESWHGLLAPAHTPPSVIERLNHEINLVLEIPEVRRLLINAGTEPVGTGPKAFSEKIAKEIDRWRKVAKLAHLKID